MSPFGIGRRIFVSLWASIVLVATLHVQSSCASIVLGNLDAIYDGSPKNVTALPQAIVTTAAGNSIQNAGQPFFEAPVGVARDGTGALYVIDAGSASTIWKITASGTTIFAGQPDIMGYADGPGTAAKFFDPKGVAVDGGGNVFVADSGNSLVRKITPGGTVSTLAGSYGKVGNIDGIGSAATFWQPHGLAVDSAGNVYVADGNACIRKVTPGGVVTTIAGSPGKFGHVDGMGSSVRFNYFIGIALDGAGNIYVTDGGIYIRKITPGGSVSTLAGAAGIFGWGGYADGIGSAAMFDGTDGLAIDVAGNVIVVDCNNAVIRKVTAAGVVTTIAGLAGSTGSADGIGSAARFYSPTGLALSSDGTLYVADAQNHLIRKVTGATGTLNVTYNESSVAPTAAGSYAVVATLSNPNYQDTATGTLVIAKATPTITWATPNAVISGTTLSSTQLNASANVPGTFVYTPAEGTAVDSGVQTLIADFTPSDTTNYNATSAQRAITVIIPPSNAVISILVE